MEQMIKARLQAEEKKAAGLKVDKKQNSKKTNIDSEDVKPEELTESTYQDQIEFLYEEVAKGHYYSDSNQFHDFHRQFKDLHLQYNPKVD